MNLRRSSWTIAGRGSLLTACSPDYQSGVTACADQEPRCPEGYVCNAFAVTYRGTFPTAARYSGAPADRPAPVARQPWAAAEALVGHPRWGVGGSRWLATDGWIAAHGRWRWRHRRRFRRHVRWRGGEESLSGVPVSRLLHGPADLHRQQPPAAATWTVSDACNDDACEAQCETMNRPGAMAFQPFLTCGGAKCSQACGSPNPPPPPPPGGRTRGRCHRPGPVRP
jgi:hypothetical protein